MLSKSGHRERRGEEEGRRVLGEPGHKERRRGESVDVSSINQRRERKKRKKEDLPINSGITRSV